MQKVVVALALALNGAVAFVPSSSRAPATLGVRVSTPRPRRATSLTLEAEAEERKIAQLIKSAEEFNVLAKSSDKNALARGAAGLHSPARPNGQGAPGDLAEAVGVASYNAAASLAAAPSMGNLNYQKTIDNALRRIEVDMRMLDSVVGGKAQLSGTEFIILAGCAATAGLSPFLFSLKVTEVLVPSCAALSAAVGVSAEYVGRTSVSNGKEIAAVTVQAAAEAEALLANAERAKAIVPLCVGISVTAGAFALLAPEILEGVGKSLGVELLTELYLIFPIISVLAAAVAGLAYQETQLLINRAIGTGVRRFANSETVGSTWMSEPQQVMAASDRQYQKFKEFALGTLPAPLLGAVLPGDLAFKSVVVATSAAAQAAYYLTCSEYEISRGMNAVAVKMRAAAVAETYANQGARSGAILPFTSALGALTAAGAAAIAEVVPLIHAVPLQAAASLIFPAAGGFIAAAAAVSKARCEVDAAAAKSASESFGDAGGLLDQAEKGAGEPIRGLLSLIAVSISSFKALAKRKFRQLFGSNQNDSNGNQLAGAY